MSSFLLGKNLPGWQYVPGRITESQNPKSGRMIHPIWDLNIVIWNLLFSTFLVPVRKGWISSEFKAGGSFEAEE
jgi:hypothetical protein